MASSVVEAQTQADILEQAPGRWTNAETDQVFDTSPGYAEAVAGEWWDFGV